VSRQRAHDVDERWRLQDEREFLERSLRDARLELEAGDLSEADFAILSARDHARLAEVRSSIDELDRAAAIAKATARSAGKAEQPAATAAEDEVPRSRRRWLLVLGAAAIAAGVVVLVIHLTTERQPGQPSSGNVALNPTQSEQQQLVQAATQVQQGDVVDALRLYRQILATDPSQPEALAESGWLEWESGRQAKDADTTAKGRALVQRAVDTAPSFYAGHLFLGTILLEEDNNPAGAVAQYQQFLAASPPAADIASAAPFLRAAFQAAGVPLPPQVPAN
jgi:tetratricopeptide (TPR) repeat protein